MQIAYYLNSAKNTEYINAGGKPLTPFEAEFAIWDEAISKKIIKRIGILK